MAITITGNRGYKPTDVYLWLSSAVWGPIISSFVLELDYPGFLGVNDSYNVGPPQL